jgi:hypothetical protein
MGGGTVSTLASPPTQTLDLKTDIVGQVSFTWQLGPAPGPQVVEAILATGSRASCYAEAIAPPQIVALWPPRGVELRQATTPAWFDLWVQTPRLQITTTRPLSIDPAADLSGWVRVWHLPAAYQPGQPLGTVAVLAAQTLIVPAILGSPGTAIEISLSAADLPVGVAEARFLVQIRTDPAVPSPITDDGQPVDADFAGSGLPLDLLQAIWDTGACGDTAVRANAAAPTGVALPSGDGKAGGIFHSWFDVIQP